MNDAQVKEWLLQVAEVLRKSKYPECRGLLDRVPDVQRFVHKHRKQEPYREVQDALELLLACPFPEVVELSTGWIDYHKHDKARFKMEYELMLMDGTITGRYRPNADCWHRMYPGPWPDRVHDSQVKMIRLSREQR